MQIKEPSLNNKSNEQTVGIGIDLGTTNSVATFVQNKEISLITDEDGKSVIASCVAFAKTGEIIVGNRALQYLNNEDYIVIKSIKRLIGTGKTIDIFGKKYNAIQISALILKYIKNISEKFLKTSINTVVISVPAGFDDAQRNETKMAAKMIDLEVKQIINEPTAAALAYGLDREKEGNYIVYDLGGGTFDVSILKMQMGIFRVVASGGDVNLGGDDIDKALIDYIKNKYNIEINSVDIAKTIALAEEIKIHLSSHAEYAKDVEISGTSYNIKISKQEFEKISLPIINKTVEIITDTVQNSGIETSEFAGIILVGGMTKMPMISSKLQEVFHYQIFSNLDPDRIVGMGAGIKAAGKTSGFQTILLDICPLSIGIETIGGIHEKIIHRSSPIPCSVVQNFTTSVDFQTAISLNIVQGEREMVKDCRSIGKLVLKNIPVMRAGCAKLKVQFDIDIDGILSVYAIEETSGNKISTQINPNYGMDYSIMSEMLIESIQNAKQDMDERLTQETIRTAQEDITNVEKAIKEDVDMLTSEELEKINSAKKMLELAILHKNKEQIESKTAEFQEICKEFMIDRMNKYIQKSVKGSKV